MEDKVTRQERHTGEGMREKKGWLMGKQTKI